MKTKLFFVLLLAVQAFCLKAQQSHPRLECSGQIPKEFLSSSQSKYKEAVRSNKAEHQRREAKTLSRFELEGNYNLDELLRSGRVLFNDEVSNYLADVSQVLLKAKPLAGGKSISVYTLRSAAVNAFATGRGEVFVTLGLLAHLNNEAQLAYIIAHELAHVEQKHSHKFYLESDRLDRGESRSVLKRASADERLLSLVAFSKENEHEADRIGLDRMLVSPYRTATLSAVFEVLKYSYLPYADQPFERSLLESEHYRLPKEYWLENSTPIKGEDEDEEDNRSSHPNIKSRREAMMAVLNQHADDPGKSDYVVSAERFEKLRRIARHELPMLYLHADQHADAIYTAGLLLQEDPQSLVLKKHIAKALYLNAKFRNSKEYVWEGDYKDIEGESQAVHYLLENIPIKEATLLAWHFAWNLHRAHPEDEELIAITKDLFFEFAREYDDFAKLKNEKPVMVAVPDTVAVVAATVAEPDTTTSKKPSKFDLIGGSAAPAESEAATVVPADKKVSKFDLIGGPSQRVESENDYWHYAFAGQLSDETFVQYQQEALERSEEWEATRKYYKTREGKKELKERQKKGVSMDISKVVVVNPFYLQLDARKKESMRYIDSEEGQEKLREAVKETSRRAGLEAVLLDVHELTENGTETFNDLRYLNEWFAEQGDHFDLTLTPGNQQAQINAIAEKYGTDYFVWTGVISLREKAAYGRMFYVMVSLLTVPPAAPFLLYSAVKPRYEMLHFSILYDVRTGRRQIIKFDTFRKRASEAMVKAHLYDTFSQIKRKEKE